MHSEKGWYNKNYTHAAAAKHDRHPADDKCPSVAEVKDALAHLSPHLIKRGGYGSCTLLRLIRAKLRDVHPAERDRAPQAWKILMQADRAWVLK